MSKVGPCENREEGKNPIDWHYDFGFATVLYKDQFFVEDKSNPSGYKWIENPDDNSGLQVRTSEGKDIALRLNDSDAVIQGAIFLQIITSNEFCA